MLETVGNGAFSCVRVVQQRCPQPGDDPARLWACKTLQLPPPGQEPEEGQSTLEDVRNEIRILSQLDHPSISFLKEYFVEEGTYHLVLELLTGGELLEALCERGCFPEEDVRRIFRDVLDAVAYMHSLGVAHRDLKLENLVISHPDECAPRPTHRPRLWPIGIRPVTIPSERR